MKVNYRRKKTFRAKTFVIKRKALYISALLIISCFISFFSLDMLKCLSFSINSEISSMVFKLAIDTTMPVIAQANKYQIEKMADSKLLKLCTGISDFMPKSFITMQTPTFLVANATNNLKITADVTQANNSKNTEKQSQYFEDVNESSLPIMEVSSVLGGTKYIKENKNIYLNNETSYKINIEEMLNEDIKINPQKSKPLVLLVHTHTTEAYSGEGQTTYNKNTSTRTTDSTLNVVRVGNEIVKQLKDAGINAIHDTTINDYPTYSGSYTRMLKIIEGYLEKYPSIQIIIDVHRDGIIRQDGTKIKMCAEIGSDKAAQVMVLVGSDEGGLEHKNWRENLKLALRVQDKLTTMYPNLARPLSLVRERYNQHASLGSMIVEVGSDGNTLSEAILGGRCFGKALADAINEL